MSRPRNAPELARLLESAAAPLYVLDEDLTIVYMNRACRDWLGEPAAEAVLGRRCVYHTGSELAGADAVAAQLCPPPTVLAGREIAADVARVKDGRLVYRRARFVPLAPAPDSLIGVVALLGANDCEEPSPAQPAAENRESIELHEQVRRFRRHAAIRFGMDRLIGGSPAMRRARAQAELAAASGASVLLAGPPGSGRRHMAEAIHYAVGVDSAAPLVPWECPLLEPDLIRSTLRALLAGGVGRGSAARPSLLLIEADQLPPESQEALAAVLSGMGGSLRLMATAAGPLAESVRRGRFREDLAASLTTITIELPPLARRREDVPLLAQALLEEVAARGSRQLGGFTAEALDRLDAYPWPGNVAELAQVVAESYQRAAGLEITPADLPERLRLAAEAAARPRRKEEPIVLDEFLARIERELIRRALARAKGNKAKAARLLGLNRPRLYRRMVQLGIEGEIGG